jgi:uncharacterized protein YlaI
MSKIIRSRQGFEESDMSCPWCGHEHDVNVMRKLFERSGNKNTMMTTCDECDKRVSLQLHKLGHFSFYRYVDQKKRRMIKAGWEQKRFYAPVDYSK